MKPGHLDLLKSENVKNAAKSECVIMEYCFGFY